MDIMITLGKHGSLQSRRKAIGFIRTPEAVRKVFDGPNSLASRFQDRKGNNFLFYESFSLIL